MCVAEGLLLLLIRPIPKALAGAITNELRLAVVAVTPAILKHAHSKIRERDENRRTETRQHRDDTARVCGSLFGAECLGTDQVASRVSNVDNGEDDGLFGTTGGIGLRQRDENDVRRCSLVSRRVYYTCG